MPKKPNTSKTATKNIRFSYRILEQIAAALEEEKSRNFSAWVIDACRLKLRDNRRKKTK
ncbi:DUF3950 domain-containing protein [Salmonella enterica]|nr:DUF3950 domain-containing protein [Salmonella enterica]EBE6988192.1 DUF3950 domain-containing protein [Salmonella enterica]EEI5751786.1 DUF3950 domain-containing protein [Salmonella enterica]EFU9296154.1 DUF3950 domain-containing protein [Salmonella enterica]EGP2891329.1 DUF3950 domain-containing protein [Salmonella enterica]